MNKHRRIRRIVAMRNIFFVLFIIVIFSQTSCAQISGKKPQKVEDVFIPDVEEGGLMGLAVHPEFARKPYIYAMHTYRKEGELYNRVIRLKDKGLTGVFAKVIIDGIPGGRAHDGGRVAFGPDGLLYIGLGRTFN